jgi:hypothetical protein
VERGGRGEGEAFVSGALAPLALGVNLAHDRGEQGVHPELFVVVDVLITQCEGHDALGDELPGPVLDSVRVVVVHEALRKPAQDLPLLLDPEEKQGTGVRGDVAAVESGDEFASSRGLGSDLVAGTLCHRSRRASGERGSSGTRVISRTAAH